MRGGGRPGVRRRMASFRCEHLRKPSLRPRWYFIPPEGPTLRCVHGLGLWVWVWFTLCLGMEGAEKGNPPCGRCGICIALQGMEDTGVLVYSIVGETLNRVQGKLRAQRTQRREGIQT